MSKRSSGKDNKDSQETKFKCQSAPVENTLEELNTSRSNGLSSKEAEKRLEKYGKNELPGKKKVRIWKVILNQLKSPLIYILIAAAIVSAVVGEIKDMVFILFIIVLNTGLGTYQEWRAEKSAESLQDYLNIEAIVLRDGQKRRVDSESLVPGDIIELVPGDKVPADIRLINTKNLTVDESLLTGESLPVEKNARKSGEETEEISECNNLAFAGTKTTSGRATGIVIRTGLDTEIGKLAKTVYGEEQTKPPLLIRMDKFAKQVGLVVLGGIVILAVVAITQGYGYLETFLLAVALAVSAIPAGLPVAVTVALSISTNRMAERNVIVRKLAAVESLGSCTLIASDKTGTLTKNEQTAKMIMLSDEKRLEIPAEKEDKGQEFPNDLDKGYKELVEELIKVSVTDNQAEIKKENGSFKGEGNPIEVALLALSDKYGLEHEAIKEKIEIIGDIPFDSDKKYSATFYRAEGDGNDTHIALKGAPEVVISMASKMTEKTRDKKIDPKKLKKITKDMAKDGYRLLAIAKGSTKKKKGIERPKKEDIKNLRFLGIVGFKDPLRHDAKESIQEAKRAGVEVAMLTGDNPETAYSIASDLGLAGSEEDVITGRDLSEIKKESQKNEEEGKLPRRFIDKVRSANIFARVSPLQKLDIIEAFKKIGHFVAVTGDGVNDAPALKKANIGVAMGSGTDVTKDTASIIATDDSFSSIVSGIEEGRFAYSNIRKVTYLLISTGAAEVILFMAALISGLPLALVAIQLLWLNLVTNGIQDVALAFEKGEPGVMDEPPRDPSEGVFNSLMIQQVVISGLVMGAIAFGVWYYLVNNGYEVSTARNLLLLLMVLLQNIHIFNCRSEKMSTFKIPIKNNYLLIGGVIAAQGIHIGSMYIPFMQNLLGIQPITLAQWSILLGIACVILLVMELFKFIRKRLSK